MRCCFLGMEVDCENCFGDWRKREANKVRDLKVDFECESFVEIEWKMCILVIWGGWNLGFRVLGESDKNQIMLLTSLS